MHCEERERLRTCWVATAKSWAVTAQHLSFALNHVSGATYADLKKISMGASEQNELAKAKLREHREQHGC
jgi:hypothetical protein